MKIGDYELPDWKVYVLAAMWCGFWFISPTVRPTVLALGTTNPAVVRRADWSLFGLRCKVTAGTELGPQRVRFHAFAGPQACKDLSANMALKLRLLKLGPVYWVQLDNDYGWWRFQMFLALLGFMVTTPILGGIVYWLTRRQQKPLSVQELRDTLNKL